MERYPAHPWACIFPLHDGDKLSDLRKDIRANGLKDKIVLYQGHILDGRRRESCLLLEDIELAPEHFREFGSLRDDGGDPLHYVIRRNLLHRHLTDTERALAAAEIAAMQGISQCQAAAAMGVPVRTTKRAAKIVKSGSQVLRAAVANGTLSISDAAEIADEPAEVQAEAVRKVANGEASTARAAIGPNGRKAKPQPQPEGAGKHGDLKRVLVRIIASEGPQTIESLTALVSKEITAVLNPSLWFVFEGKRWHITNMARAEVLAK